VRVWSVVTVVSVEINGFNSFFEIQDVVNFDSFNLLNPAGEDLRSGVHVRKIGRALIRSLHKPPHGG
jgi:hypothetical protein